jgi:hypothetical protein
LRVLCTRACPERSRRGRIPFFHHIPPVTTITDPKSEQVRECFTDLVQFRTPPVSRDGSTIAEKSPSAIFDKLTSGRAYSEPSLRSGLFVYTNDNMTVYNNDTRGGRGVGGQGDKPEANHVVNPPASLGSASTSSTPHTLYCYNFRFPLEVSSCRKLCS